MGTTLPRHSTEPSVGFMMPEMIFRSVLLPAPLRPMRPIVSPFCTSNETCSSAVNVLYCSLPRNAVVTNSLSDKILSLFMRNRIVTSETRIIVLLSIKIPPRYR